MNKLIRNKNKNLFNLSCNKLTNLLPLFLLSFLLFCTKTTLDSTVFVEKNIELQEITLVFGGDVMQHMPQVNAAWDEQTKTYNYDSCFSFIKPFFEKADFAVINLETTLAGKPYAGYPAFSSPDMLAISLKNMGIDLIGTANNHCCDRGREGIERTIRFLDSLNINHMGTYLDEESYNKQNPHIVNIQGFTLAFMNYTYGTNGLPIPTGNVVSQIENNRILADLYAVKKAKPDKVIVFIHWGEEYQRYPNSYQQETAKLLFDNGADIIIGSHPHVIQHIEWIKPDSIQKERFVAWSMGNFVSNQRKQYTDGGCIIQLTLKKQYGQTSISDAGYMLTWVHTPYENGKKKYYILPAAMFENDSARLSSTDKNVLKSFIQDSRELLNAKNINVKELK